MAAADYDKYIIREPVGKSGMFEQIVAPQLFVGGERHLGGANFALGWSYITQPFLMVDETHAHDFDQILFFLGGNPMDVGDFEAEVELGLGEEAKIHRIDATSAVYIPAGLMHGPLDIKSVDKPFVFIDIVLSPQASVRRKPAGQ